MVEFIGKSSEKLATYDLSYDPPSNIKPCMPACFEGFKHTYI
jgi:hypothetical protein